METETTRLAATSPVEARKRALGGRVHVLGFRWCTRSLEGRSADPDIARDEDDAAGRGVTDGRREEEILGFYGSGGEGGRSCRRLRVP
jgi:hypothetical protein